MDLTEVEWSERIPADEWAIESSVIELASHRGLRFALGGGLAFSTYARRWRNSKDIDLFILPDERDAMIQVTRDASFRDLFDELPYQRHWIYRSTRDGIIVDLIWQMANSRTQVTEEWLTRGEVISIRGCPVRLAPPEEMIYSKLFVLQRDRCDWPDMLNMLAAQIERLDWGRLLELVGETDLPLFGGFLSVFRWLTPARSRHIPEFVWECVGLMADGSFNGADEHERAMLLDSRDWYGTNMNG